MEKGQEPVIINGKSLWHLQYPREILLQLRAELGEDLGPFCRRVLESDVDCLTNEQQVLVLTAGQQASGMLILPTVTDLRLRTLQPEERVVLLRAAMLRLYAAAITQEVNVGRAFMMQRAADWGMLVDIHHEQNGGDAHGGRTDTAETWSRPPSGQRPN